MMRLKQFVLVLFMEISIILPIVLEARAYHGYNFYRHFRKSRNNAGQSRSLNSEEIAVESHNHQGVKYFRGGNNRRNSEDSIVFPDSIALQPRNAPTNTKYEIGPMTICNGKTFCEDIPNYPQKLVDQALAKKQNLLPYANMDIIDTTIKNRFGDTGEDSLCVYTEQLIRPKFGQTIKKEWLFIVQSSESNFTQAIRVEICEEEDSSCRIIDDFAEGYSTTCKQKYVYRQMSAISKDGEIITDFFRFPASCCCHIEEDFDL